MFGNIDLEGITSKLENILDKIDKGGIESVSSTFQNVADITQKIKDGESSIGKLVKDDELVNRINGVIAQLNARIIEAKTTISEINAVLRRINQGPGSVHTLIYKDDVGAVMQDLKVISKNLEDVSNQIKEIVADINDADVAKKVGDVAQKIGDVADNVISASQSVENIAKSIEEGEGTVGALIKDPTLYEDLKVILQGAKRSKALQYAIQHTIQQKQKAAEKEKAKSPEPPPHVPRPAPLPEPMTHEPR